MNRKTTYKSIFKSQRDKEKSLLNIQYTLNTKQGYFDRLLLRDLCDNAKRKGKYYGGIISALSYTKEGKLFVRFEELYREGKPFFHKKKSPDFHRDLRLMDCCK